ncbi:MAG: alkaline phosphatase family protein [Vicinamibacterales bacterium]
MTSAPKLVIIGFDGMDPDLLRRYIAEGRMPNMAKLAAEGALTDLATSHSPESPTAWASFATGVQAGKHNIYDFLVRDTETYLPDLGMVRLIPPKFLFDYIPRSRPKVETIRGGTSFWVTAGEAGIRSSILTVPVTFPAEKVPNGELLSGLPLPDIRGTMGTFYYFGTDLSRYEEGNTEMGGILKRLVFENNIADTELTGPANPIVKQKLTAIRNEAETNSRALTDAERRQIAELEATEDVRVPMKVHWTRTGDPSATIEIQGESVKLRPGEWSRWIDLDFRINFFVRVKGMAQLYLIDAGQELQLYVSPVNWRPDAPPMPMSYPDDFAEEIYDRIGRFRTLGWAEATWPLNEGRMDEATFLDDAGRAFDDRANVILSRLESRDWDLLVGVIESTDRVQHMFWRLEDPSHPMYDASLVPRFGAAIRDVYERSDTFVGEVLKRLEPGTTLMIVSDHGFHSWRKAVNLNTWLVQQGYMAVQGQQPGEKKLDDLFGGGEFWENVDWSRTKAYAMGLGQVYFNVRGREGKGIVSPGQEYQQLAAALSAKLLTLQDPDDGNPIVRAVYKRDDVYSGEFLHNAPDLQVGFHDGYRVSWQTTLGGSPQGIVYPNMKKWSGDHGGYDFAETAGVLVSNRKLTGGAARIIDIAPTVLKHFGLQIPGGIDGKALY